MAICSDSWTFDLVILLIGSFALCYWFLKYKHTYWQRNGFTSYPNPNLLFGHFAPTFTQNMFIGVLIRRIYRIVQEPFVGIYGFFSPILLVRDPELVRNILIRDFQYFMNHGVHCDEINDPFSGTLFALSGKRWKHIRGKLSPAFTSGKLKAMFSTLVDCGPSLQNHLEKLCDKDELLDVQEIAASYGTNVIASLAFGIEVDAIKDPNNEFRVCGRKIFETSYRNGFRMFFNYFAPKLMSFFRIKCVDDSVEKFIMSVVKQNLDYREKNNVTRKDFLQLLIQLRNSGTMQVDGEWESVSKCDENQKSLTFNEIAAQMFTFFEAGFESSSTELSFCMHELAKHPEIQLHVHEEIDRVLQQHDGQITYESISEMKYLEACINEALRKYPVGTILNRICGKDYKIPGTDKVIKKGVEIFISAWALQMNETYYDEPEKFKPERFLDGNSTNRPYYPFGGGPRTCIAMKLGKRQIKVGILFLLLNHKYELKSKRDVEFNPKHFLLSPKDPIQLRVIRR